MNDRIQNIKERLLQAIRAQQEKGVEIIAGRFDVELVDGKWMTIGKGFCCCVLGAFLLEAQPPIPSDNDGPVNTTARALNITLKEAWSIVHGFDNLRIANSDPGLDVVFFNLGRELRQEINPRHATIPSII